MLAIIGGKQVSYNLFDSLNKQNIDSVVYTFKGEWCDKKNIGKLINQFSLEDCSQKKVIPSSETALNYLQKNTIPGFDTHHFLRNKKNISKIAPFIGLECLDSLTKDNIADNLPVILKPIQANNKVPFKVKIVANLDDIKKNEEFLDYCIIQKYLSPIKYRQISIAGYFNGSSKSLICVDQLNQFPMGTSSHVRINYNHTDKINLIATYLNTIDYYGFIEFEIKYSESVGYYLIDINPRLWGWSYFYLSGIKNMRDIIFENRAPILNLKNEWINPIRLTCSFLHGKWTLPLINNILNGKVCMEPFKL